MYLVNQFKNLNSIRKDIQESFLSVIFFLWDAIAKATPVERFDNLRGFYLPGSMRENCLKNEKQNKKQF